MNYDYTKKNVILKCLHRPYSEGIKIIWLMILSRYYLVKKNIS